MAQVTINAFVYHCSLGRSEEGGRFVLFNGDSMEDRWYTLVGPVEVTYEVPDDFNPTRAELAKLEREKAAVREAFQKRMAEINERCQKLMAIENTVEAA